MNRQLAFDALAATLVAAVIGVLAYPFVQGHLHRARQAEAKNNLILIHTLQQSHYQARGLYRAFKGVGSGQCGDDELGFKLGACDRARYAYSATVDGTGTGKGGFTALARAAAGAIVPGCKVRDAWEIDQTRQLRARKGRDAVQACRR